MASVSLGQFVETLEHNKDNTRDSDIWVLNQDGSTSIVPDQPIAELQRPATWPKYICRAGAVNAHVASDGLDAALDHINWAIQLTMPSVNLGAVPAALARSVRRLRTGVTK